MWRTLRLVAIAIVVIVIGFSLNQKVYGEEAHFKLPKNLHIECSSDLPQNIAFFCGEWGYESRWGNVKDGVPHKLFVTYARSDGFVRIIYAWGWSPKWQSFPGYANVPGEIIGDTLTARLPNGVEVIYTIDGQNLRGKYGRVPITLPRTSQAEALSSVQMGS